MLRQIVLLSQEVLLSSAIHKAKQIIIFLNRKNEGCFNTLIRRHLTDIKNTSDLPIISILVYFLTQPTISKTYHLRL